jgi:hypothetical protein
MQTRNILIKASIAIAIATSLCQTAHAAGWDTDGMGVINFPSTNPRRVVFNDRIRSTTAELIATDRTEYDQLAPLVDTAVPKNVTPQGDYIFGQQIVMPSKLVAILDESKDKHKVVIRNVHTGAGAPCTPTAFAAGSCAHAGLTTVSEVCRYNEVKVTGNITGKLQSPAGTASLDTGLIAEWTSGYKACLGAGEYQGCLQSRVNFNSKLHATSETRNRFNNFKFTTNDTRIIFMGYRPGTAAADKAYCENRLRGIAGQTTDGTGRIECRNIQVKPYYKKFVLLPIQSGQASYTGCRTVKDIF